MGYRTNLDQARHNKELCEYLLKDGNFNDWVITTAFYSSLHFVLYKAFECEEGLKKKYKDFEDYYMKNNFKEYRLSKHAAIKNIAFECLGIEISAEYQNLMDKCHTARYRNKKTHKNEADHAYATLKMIEEACVSPKKK